MNSPCVQQDSAVLGVVTWLIKGDLMFVPISDVNSTVWNIGNAAVFVCLSFFAILNNFSVIPIAKTYAIQILMNHMRISTNQVSSVMLRSKKLKIRGKNENYERADENQTEFHEIEPNLSKDRAMHEGDNPSF
jgi:hypothetical protein